MVREFLIKLLHGMTLNEYNKSLSDAEFAIRQQISLLEKHLGTKDQLFALKEVENQGLRLQIESLTKDRDFYREKLFLEKGILFPEVQDNRGSVAHLEPVSTSRVPWNIRRRKLEREDLKRAAALQQDAKAQADETKSYWDKKNEANRDAVQ